MADSNMNLLFPEIPCIGSDMISLRQVTLADAEALQELVDSPAVNRYLPTFLFEHRYPDIRYVIEHLYDECLEESLILGVYDKADAFCGLAEFYGYQEEIHKVSLGCRFLEKCWGRGIATETLRVMVDYLYTETDIEIITASTMVENIAPGKAAQKCGFDLVVRSAPEDWGYPESTMANKWIRRFPCRS